ncbi:MAG: FAD-dependent oxidoreductase [Candidatus Methylomirabilis sp.]|nr:FAD-dependent oxidoreductase [Deltaproteobacteria bacterium]
MSVVILGAGLAGLSAAHHLKSELRILEKDAEPGGLCRSRYGAGFTFDHGPHLFFGKDAYYRRLVRRFVAPGLHARRADAGQHSFGVTVPFPYAVHLRGMPTDVVVRCVRDYVRARASLDDAAPADYRAWCEKHFGAGFAALFMSPYARKIWTVEPEALSTDWVSVRIVTPPVEDVIEGAVAERRIDATYIGDFLYPKRRGAQALVDGFTRRTPAVETEREIVELSHRRRAVTLADGETVRYERLVSTIPLPVLIARMTDAPRGIREAAARLVHTSVVTVNLGVDRADLSPYQWLYFDDPAVPFYRVSFPHRLAPANAPRGCGSLSAEISFSKHRALPKGDLVARVRKSLEAVGVLRRGDAVLHAEAVTLPFAYVLFDHARRAAVGGILPWLESRGIHPIGRFGRWDYLWTHDVILDGRRVAERIDRDLGAR